MRTKPVALLPLAIALALVAGGCGSTAAKKLTPTAAPVAAKCPAAALAGWRKLAKRVDAPVYCPSWMPQPLDSTIGGDYATPADFGPDHSYLVSFIDFDMIPNAPYEVHVNLRGYPGRTTIPMCKETLTTAGHTILSNVPCFADPLGHVRFGNTTATIYTVNQGIDTWHVLYAWRYDGSLYTISQHLAPPFTYSTLLVSLDKILHGLVLVRP